MQSVLIPDRMSEPQIAPISWDAFEAELLAVYTPPQVAPATRKKIVQILRELRELGVQTTADLNTTLVARFVSSRPPDWSTWTLRGSLINVRTLCRYAEASGYLRVSPFRLRKMARWVRVEPLEGKRHLSRDELRKLLAVLAADVESRAGWSNWRARRLQIAVAIAAFCGLRKLEILRLQVGDIDLANGIIHLRPHGKRFKTAGSAKPVPMPDALIALLQNWMGHRLDAPFGYPLPKECSWLIPLNNRKGPWDGGSPGHTPLAKLQEAGRRAGIENVTWQMLRRSLATVLESHGCGEAMISRILRHSSIQVTKTHYRQADCENLRQATAGLDF
jgi:integrase